MSIGKIYVVFLCCAMLVPNLQAEVVKVSFYSQKVAIGYDASIKVEHSFTAADESIKQYYQQIQKTNYQVVLGNLKKAKSSLGLNDWFYYELVRNTSREIFKNESANYQQAFTWFMLTESGYNVVIGYEKTFELFIHSKSDVYKRSIITLGDRDYVSVDNFIRTSASLAYCQFNPGIENRSFNFSIDLPRLEGDSIITVKKEFLFNGTVEKYEYSISRNFLELMKQYPKLESKAYFNVQISPVTHQSLIPQLRNRIEGMSKEDAVRYLLSFVRLTFSPKFDAENKPVDFAPMIAEETLFYQYGDCEGKSVLFYYLVKELVGSPMVAVMYPNHINVAVKLNSAYGNAIQYNNALYTVCEPNAVSDAIHFDQPGSSEKFASARILAID